MEKQENGKMKGIKYKVSWLLNCYAHILFHNAYKISATQSTEIPLRTCQDIHLSSCWVIHPPLASCRLLLCVIPLVLSSHSILTCYCPTIAHVNHFTHGDSQVSQLFSSPILTTLPPVFGNALAADHLGHHTLLTQCSTWGTLQKGSFWASEYRGHAAILMRTW